MDFQETHPSSTLAYRLRKGVSCHIATDCLYLVLDYPLKSIRLKLFWQPLFCDRFSTNEYVTFELIASLFSQTVPDKIEFFLNSLVRRGFLEQQGFPALSDYPAVSIIIPVRDRPQEIGDCLKSLVLLNYPPQNIEIIVVDDCSSDNTTEVVKEFPVRLIALKEHRHASYCRNLGAEKATNDILAFIDSDCLADPNWLRELVPVFKDSSLTAVGGMIDSFMASDYHNSSPQPRMKPGSFNHNHINLIPTLTNRDRGDFRTNQLDRYEQAKSSLKVSSWFKRSKEGDDFFYVPACNFLVRRLHFLKLGGFRNDLQVGEDVDFCWRLQDNGNFLEYRPVGRIYHQHRNQLPAFCSRRFDYGTSESLLQKLHKKRRKRMIFPPATVIFWVIVVFSIYRGEKMLALGSLCVPLVDSLIKQVLMLRQDVPITCRQTLRAVLRSYFAWLYHFIGFISRYYLLLSFLAIPFAPILFFTAVGMHILAGLGEYFLKKTSLNFLSFFFYFTLDQLSYQSGVWWGCFKNRYFGPVFPRIFI